MEFVFVVPRGDLFPECYPHGLTPFGAGIDRETFEGTALDRGFFVERAYAERTPSLKQVIPYAIVCVDESVLLVRRLNAGGEARLHDKLSIGIGGHINPVDAADSPAALGAAGTTSNIFTAATAREIGEELTIDGDFTVRAVGVLNDDSNAVGAVHVGLVQVVQVRGSVAIRETDQLEGRLVPPSELQRLAADGANFESWSHLLVEALDELVPHSTITLS
jgi:predicted NUDIX family phosphoesterase